MGLLEADERPALKDLQEALSCVGIVDQETNFCVSLISTREL